MANYTISGAVTEPDDVTPWRGFYYVGNYTDTGILLDADGSWRAGEHRIQIDREGDASISLPESEGDEQYFVRFEPFKGKPKGPWVFALTEDMTWAEIIDLPAPLPLDPTWLQQAQEAADAAVVAAAEAVDAVATYDVGTFYPQKFGTVTYGTAVTSGQATANGAAIQAAIDAAATLTRGGQVRISRITEVRSGGVSALTLKSGVHLAGPGVGGDIFGNSRGSVLRLNAGANQDLVRTENFAALTGQTAPGTEPTRFGIRDLVLDGNKAGNSSGKPLRIYGRCYSIRNVIVQNGAEGGVYSEWVGGGYQMESYWSDVQIFDCVGDDSLSFYGPHDSHFVSVVVARGTGKGIDINTGSAGSIFVGVHVWGAHTKSWHIKNACSLVACSGEGATVTQLHLDSQEVNIDRASHFFNAFAGASAIIVGDTTTGAYPSRCRVAAKISNYDVGIDFRREGGGNQFDLLAYPAAGATTLVGTPSALTEYRMRADVSLSGEVGLDRDVTRTANATGSSTTGNRPPAATVKAGAQWYDTTLGKPIWSDGTNWKDAAGTTV